MSNVVTMSGKTPAVAQEPNAKIIAALEQMLQEAKDGRIQQLAAIYSDGAAPPSDLYVGSGEPVHAMALIGGLELCKHTMLMSFYQDSAADTAYDR
jgi:hypothetical protein